MSQVSGLAVLAFMSWGVPLGVGIILLVEAIIPVGDMLVVLAAKGSARSAFGIHGLTAVLMVLAAIRRNDRALVPRKCGGVNPTGRD